MSSSGDHLTVSLKADQLLKNLIAHSTVVLSFLARIKRTVRNTQQQHQVVVEKWSDCVDDLWAKHFPHLSEMVRVEQNSAYVQQGELDADVTDELAVSLNKEPEEKVEDSNVLKRSEQVEEGQLKGTENSGNSGTTLPGKELMPQKYLLDNFFLFKICHHLLVTSQLMMLLLFLRKLNCPNMSKNSRKQKSVVIFCLN